MQTQTWKAEAVSDTTLFQSLQYPTGPSPHSGTTLPSFVLFCEVEDTDGVCKKLPLPLYVDVRHSDDVIVIMTQALPHQIGHTSMEWKS